MNPLTWIDSALWARWIETLGHFLWQGTAIALVASVVSSSLARGSSRAQYAVNVIALVLMAACVPATFLLLDSSPAVLGYSVSTTVESSALTTSSVELVTGLSIRGAQPEGPAPRFGKKSVPRKRQRSNSR